MCSIKGLTLFHSCWLSHFFHPHWLSHVSYLSECVEHATVSVCIWAMHVRARRHACVCIHRKFGMYLRVSAHIEELSICPYVCTYQELSAYLHFLGACIESWASCESQFVNQDVLSSIENRACLQVSVRIESWAVNQYVQASRAARESASVCVSKGWTKSILWLKTQTQALKSRNFPQV